MYKYQNCIKLLSLEFQFWNLIVIFLSKLIFQTKLRLKIKRQPRSSFQINMGYIINCLCGIYTGVKCVHTRVSPYGNLMEGEQKIYTQPGKVIDISPAMSKLFIVQGVSKDQFYTLNCPHNFAILTFQVVEICNMKPIQGVQTRSERN